MQRPEKLMSEKKGNMNSKKPAKLGDYQEQQLVYIVILKLEYC